MDRKIRTRILAEDKTGLASTLSALIQGRHKITEVQPPKEGLVMIRLREQARNTLFYFGEVLVTEARVRINGSPGLGIVQGLQADLARDMAIVDAACAAGVPELAEIEERLQEAGIRNEQLAADKRGKVMKTRVSFSSMQKEDYLK
ncbi:MAG: phosphonate C-P lyase system protein PhnG [Spirochaetales bacterium]|nr:phosphonate C-P lyase system protein PhnG [Spirochaetales bacterium]